MYARGALLRFFAQHDGELGLTGFGRVIEGRAFAIAFGGAEKESLPRVVGKADEAGLAIGIGADFEIELMEIHESVGDVDTDVGGIDWRIGVVGDGEISGAGAEAGVDGGDCFGVGDWTSRRCGIGLRSCKGKHREGEHGAT